MISEATSSAQRLHSGFEAAILSRHSRRSDFGAILVDACCLQSGFDSEAARSSEQWFRSGFGEEILSEQWLRTTQ